MLLLLQWHHLRQCLWLLLYLLCLTAIVTKNSPRLSHVTWCLLLLLLRRWRQLGLLLLRLLLHLPLWWDLLLLRRLWQLMVTCHVRSCNSKGAIVKS